MFIYHLMISLVIKLLLAFPEILFECPLSVLFSPIINGIDYQILYQTNYQVSYVW